jgi:hypothetical protein
MSIFCEHNWVKIKETYAEPIQEDHEVKGHPSIRMIGLFQGLTTILWECSKCNKIRKEEMLGK